MSENDDNLLFEKVKKGDLKAFEVLFKEYYGPITRFALSMVRDKSIAEEIAQEIFMYLWEKKEQIELKTVFKSYLFTSAKYKAINYIKLELPKLQATTDLEGIRGFSQPDMASDDSERLKIRIQFAIEQLPEKCKNIFVLSRYGGMTYVEIAEDLGLSVKTIENQMSIALKKLKESLSEDLKEYHIR